MNIATLLNTTPLPLGELLTVEAKLMTRGVCPFLGLRSTDWDNNRCLHLTDQGLFERLLDIIFPHNIVGSDTLFLYPAIVVGRLRRDSATGTLSLSELESLSVEVGSEMLTLPLTGAS